MTTGKGIEQHVRNSVRELNWRDFLVLRCILIFFTVSDTKHDAAFGGAVCETVKKSKDTQK